MDLFSLCQTSTHTRNMHQPERTRVAWKPANYCAFVIPLRVCIANHIHCALDEYYILALEQTLHTETNASCWATKNQLHCAVSHKYTLDQLCNTVLDSYIKLSWTYVLKQSVRKAAGAATAWSFAERDKFAAI